MSLKLAEIGEYLSSAQVLTSAYRNQSISPTEVVSSILREIETHNPSINAFRFVDVDGAMEAARLSEEKWRRGEPRGILEGVPVTVKDVVAVEGWQTTFGSASNRLLPSGSQDSPPVQRLRENGAILLGQLIFRILQQPD